MDASYGPVSASRSEITEIVLPNDANLLGNMLGGRVMHLIDIAGALCATRHANLPVVTASVDYLDFKFPIPLGEWAVLQSQVNRVFTTSMEVGVKVYAENVMTGERRHTSSAYLKVSMLISPQDSGRKEKNVVSVTMHPLSSWMRKSNGNHLFFQK